jgi:uncharacterized membrane protein
VIAAIVATARAMGGDAMFADPRAIAWALVAGVLEWAYFASLAKALAQESLGPVYTISRGGAIVLVWPISIAAFGEHLTTTSAIGSAIVLAGLALTSSGGRFAITSAMKGSALLWSVVCAGSIAGYHLSYKAALTSGGSPSAVFALALALASVINAARLGRDGRSAALAILKVRFGRVVLMGAICGGSFLILMEALARGGSGFVLTLRNTSVLFATALAFTIGERPSRPQVLGAALVAAGAVAMAWS